MKTMKLKLIRLLLAPSLMACVAYAQETSEDARTPGAPLGAIEVTTITGTSKVTAVDPTNRTLTLVNPEGATNTYKLGDGVRNFDQIKVGDEVKTTLLESLAVAVRESKLPPGATETDTVALEPKGAMPGVVIARTKELTAKIQAVDKTNRTVTIEGSAGFERPIKVGPKVNLDELQKGEDVTLRVTQGMAIRVEKP